MTDIPLPNNQMPIDPTLSNGRHHTFTRADGALLTARLKQALKNNQRWTLTAIVSGMAIVAAIHKLL
jgi:hypothetical protein